LIRRIGRSFIYQKTINLIWKNKEKELLKKVEKFIVLKMKKDIQ
jgi:hypothetical protein